MKRDLCILLVEDDEALGALTYHALVTLGHRSVLAQSVEAAYHHLSNAHNFHLVLLDLQLGDQHSEGVILRLRHEMIEIPAILIFSAQPITELQRVKRSIGAHGFIRKPASVEQIAEAIERAVA
jgi:DNA-binding NtrC family response regulator